MALLCAVIGFFMLAGGGITSYIVLFVADNFVFMHFLTSIAFTISGFLFLYFAHKKDEQYAHKTSEDENKSTKISTRIDKNRSWLFGALISFLRSLVRGIIIAVLFVGVLIFWAANQNMTLHGGLSD